MHVHPPNVQKVWLTDVVELVLDLFILLLKNILTPASCYPATSSFKVVRGLFQQETWWTKLTLTVAENRNMYKTRWIILKGWRFKRLTSGYTGKTKLTISRVVVIRSEVQHVEVFSCLWGGRGGE